ncbi:MAG: PqqD family protein [Planctomycetota bacterium]|jgi:hypothetical protein
MSSHEASTLPTVRPMVRTALTIHDLDGEALIFDPRTQDTHKLNGTAWFILRALSGSRSLGEVAIALQDTYAVEESLAQEQVMSMYRMFDGLGLLEQDKVDPVGSPSA